ncbi:MAG: hypothetical protein ACYC4U_03865 [Pirellulaceae bacterium]
MNWNASSAESLRRIFTEGFTARDIAEPLVSFDVCTPSAEAAEIMRCRSFDAVGVRRGGVVIGYVERNDLCGPTCGERVRPIIAPIADSASLADVVLGLASAPHLFVRVLGAVGGIITKADLQKPPVRMWLFGMVTLMEMRATRLIELQCGDGNWKEYLSEARLRKAEALLEERKRRNQDLALMDCLQISDKGQIIARHEELRRLTHMQSRREAEQAIKMLESLRNNLAHSQDILSTDWQTIVGLCRDIERVICGTEEVQSALAREEQQVGAIQELTGQVM